MIFQSQNTPVLYQRLKKWQEISLSVMTIIFESYNHIIGSSTFIQFVSVQQFTQPYGFKKTFIHIDISTFVSAFLFLQYYICALTLISKCAFVLACLLTSMLSVRTRTFVNAVYVLKETSVLHFHLRFFFLQFAFHLRETETHKNRKQRNKENPKCGIRS